MAFAPSAAPPAASSRADSDQERSVAGPGSATPRVAASSTEKPPGSQGAAAGSKELASLRAPARALVTASAVLPSPIAERSPLAGWIRRAPIAGGAPEVVVGRVNGAVGFVVDASHVYWIEGRFGSEKGKVLRAPKHGGTPELMLEDCAPTSLAVDETTVYVASSGCERTCGGGGIYAVPKGGGPARALAERVGNPAGLVAVGSALYWSGQLGCGFDGTVRLAKSGGAPKSVYGGGDLPFAIDGDRVFVGSLWTLFSGALATGATVATVDFKGDADGRSNIGGIAVDGESVYLTTFGGGTVERWSKTGGSVRRLATLGGRPKSVALAARHLFVADPYVDLVWRLPKEGGDPAVFARESASPEKVVVHENYVYWITR